MPINGNHVYLEVNLTYGKSPDFKISRIPSKTFSCIRCYLSKVWNALDKDTASQDTMLVGMAKVLAVRMLATTFALKSPNVLTQHGMGAKHALVTMK